MQIEEEWGSNIPAGATPRNGFDEEEAEAEMAPAASAATTRLLSRTMSMQSRMRSRVRMRVPRMMMVVLESKKQESGTVEIAQFSKS